MIGVQLAFRQILAMKFGVIVLQIHYCTLLFTQQSELRAVDLVVAVFRVSQVIVLISAVTVNHNSATLM